MVPVDNSECIQFVAINCELIENASIRIEGRKPEEFLDMDDGRTIVSRLLARMETGVGVYRDSV